MAVRSLAQSSLVEPFNTNSMLAGYSGNAFHHLETVRLSSNAATVEFTNLARYSDFQHFQIRMTARSNRATTNSDIDLRFNSDSGTNYSWHYMRGDGSVMESAGNGGLDSVRMYQTLTSATNTSNSFAATIIDILDPFETTKNTTVRFLSGFTGSLNRVLFESGAWFNTDAITSISLTEYYGSQFIAGCRFSLYGIKARA